MLSEAYTLWQALQRAGIAPERSHPDVKSPGRSGGPCLRVRLAEQGSIRGVEPVTDDEWPGLWTKIEGNHNSFPVVRLKEPLLRPAADDPVWGATGPRSVGARRTPTKAEVRAALLAALDRLEPAAPSKGQQALWARLRNEKAPLMREVAARAEDLGSLRRVAERFIAVTADPARLYRELSAAARSHLAAGETASVDALVMLLLGKGPPGAEGGLPAMSVQLAFDVDDLTSRLYQAGTRQAINRALLAAGGVAEHHPGAACAFTGAADQLQVRPFPQVRLPVLNRDFPLVAMFSEAGCNRRYWLTDALVVPVSQGVALRMQDALKWVVAPERERQTWRDVASGRFESRNGRSVEKRDLLITYVEDQPSILANLTELFGSGAEETEQQFKVDAMAVCKALEGVVQARPDSRLSLFVIRAASQGQAHVVLADAPRVRQVLDGAVWWQKAAENVPPVSFPVWNRAQKRFEWRNPEAPYPDQVVRLLAGEWVRNGTHCNTVASVGLGEVLNVMLAAAGRREQAATHILALTVQRLGPLLVGLTGALRTGRREDLDLFPWRTRPPALQAVSVLGMMLHALGRRKEDYMNSQAFLVGRLLALADTLHQEYCRHVRGGDIPPQLIGNAMVPVAASNPRDAVARLGDRMAVYKAWATKVDGDKYRLAKWCLGQLGEVCRDLKEESLPTKTTPQESAGLFLGYMARMGEKQPSVGSDAGDSRKGAGDE